MSARKPLANSRRMRLRDATSALHQSLDMTVSQSDFMTTRDGYRAYLAATLAARGAAEAQMDVSEAGRLFPSWPNRRIRHLLAQDLADLGGEPKSEDLATQTPMSDGAVWGALYVLEGSAVGARLLQRRAGDLGMTPVFGARHLAGQTAQPSAWPGFVSLLDDAPLTETQDADCLAAAVSTFGRFAEAYSSMSTR